eukprot:CAMPEP_0183730262 /NCGR_PEP_ID=MMETSP0737-20130205/32379_1 /TAXON_ID=385413 /ORGANISM="Thalassiosira miniscula, Strain CCMP1093" /LENGTH=736 /DNA_ID=CAMNT_0025962709 /DNA_START=403 /DNA_END=2613 /DNA_ORIENTATION=-
MSGLATSGMVLTNEQKKEDRRRKGFCETCSIDPNRCFEIKKKYGGLKSEKIPLTKPGKVFNGVCLDCNPERDPEAIARRHMSGNGNGHVRHHSHPHHHQQPHMGGTARERHMLNELDETDLSGHRRAYSSSSIGRGERGLVRQPGFRKSKGPRDYATSLPISLEHMESRDRLEIEQDYEQEQYPPVEQAPREPEYVEEIEYNIFNEPVIVRRKKARSKRSLRRNSNSSPIPNDTGGSPHNSPTRYSHRQQHHHDEEPEHLNYSTSPQREQSPHLQNGRNSPTRPHRQNSSQRILPRGDDEQLDDHKPPSKTENNENGNVRQSTSSGSEELDALGQMLRDYCQEHPEEAVKFVPGGSLLPQSELILPAMTDELSVMTPDTYFQGRPSVSSAAQQSYRKQLTAISETNSDASSKQRSMISHKITEPVVPDQMAQSSGDNNYGDTSVQNTESYLESSPDLTTLREFVEMFTAAGNDEEAINTVTDSLIRDNATSMSIDVALFCLATLWVLARKNDENKRKILLAGNTFESIIEAMQIYREQSAEIQTRACGVLWSLSMDQSDRKHVAQCGGIDAILNAMRFHMEDDALQVMALGALKVLSFDNLGKSTMRAHGTLSIVSDVLQKHQNNPTIQSEGCVIIGNLAVDDANQFVAAVTEKEIEALVRANLSHPESLEVHEAACFTLMKLASSATNVDLIQKNGLTKMSLEIACQKHPEEIGSIIITLLKRLKYDFLVPQGRA